MVDVLLPNLKTLVIRSVSPSEAELAAILRRVPSVVSLALSGGFELRGEEEDGSGAAVVPDPAQAPAAAPAPVMNFGGLGNVYPGPGAFARGGGVGGGGLWGRNGNVQANNQNEKVIVSLVDCLPPSLSHLSLSSPVSIPVYLCIARSFFAQLPPSLVSLSINSCKMAWSDPKSEWEYDEIPPEQTAFSFGSGVSSIRIEGQIGGPSWLSFLPQSVTQLQLRGPVALQVSHLPSQTRSLTVDRMGWSKSWSKALEDTFKPLPLGAHRSPFKWPVGITSIKLNSSRISKSDAQTFPATLTQLDCVLTQDWDQEDAASLLNQLPNCVVQTPLSVIWITDGTLSPFEPSYASLSASQRSACSRELVSADGKLSVFNFVLSRLSCVPTRIHSDWRLSTPNGGVNALDQDPKESNAAKPYHVAASVQPLTLPSTLEFTAIDIPSSYQIDFAYGRLILALEALRELFDHHISVSRKQPTSIAEEQFGDAPLYESLQLAHRYLSQDSLLASSLTSVCLSHYSAQMVPFSSLPRSLTSLKIGHHLPQSLLRPYFMSAPAWQAAYQSTATSTFTEPPEFIGGEIIQSTEDFFVSRGLVFGIRQREGDVPCGSVSDLPRSLTCYEAPMWDIPPSSDGDWPAGLTKVRFCSVGWEDRAIMDLINRLPLLEKMRVTGYVNSYGLKKLDKNGGKMELLGNEEDDFANLGGAGNGHGLRTVDWLDDIELTSMYDRLMVPFKALGVKIQSIFIPSLLSFARPTLHTLTASNAKFKVGHHKSLRSVFDSRFPTNSLQRQSYAEHLERLSLNNSLLDLQALASYRSLTSLTISMVELSWTHIALLPETLKYLACICEDPNFNVDPFIRCPRFLESLKLDCLSDIMLTANGLDHLPPGLTTLEANLLHFSPLLIPDFPRQITTLLFHGQGAWSDLDLFVLSQHIGDGLQSLSVNECILSGALVPLDSSITEYDTLSIVNKTKERLGSKVTAIWYAPSSPFQLCALDLASNVQQETSGVQMTRKDVSASLNHILSIDLHLALAPSMLEILPAHVLPTRLTSLNLRLTYLPRASEFVYLPTTLKHFSLQSKGQGSLDASVWSLLPRGLVSFAIDFISDLETPIINCSSAVYEPGITPDDLGKRDRDSNHRPPTQSPIISHLEGLPTENLQVLSLRPFTLNWRCPQAFGPALRLVRCHDLVTSPNKPMTIPDTLTIDTGFARSFAPCSDFIIKDLTESTKIILNPSIQRLSLLEIRPEAASSDYYFESFHA